MEEECEAELFGIVNACIVLEEEKGAGRVTVENYEKEWKLLVDAFCTFRDSGWGRPEFRTKEKMEAWWEGACLKNFGKKKYNSTVYTNLFVNGSVDFGGGETKALTQLSQFVFKLQNDTLAFVNASQSDVYSKSDVHNDLGSILSWSQKCEKILKAEVKLALRKEEWVERYFNLTEPSMGPLTTEQMNQLTQYVENLKSQWDTAFS